MSAVGGISNDFQGSGQDEFSQSIVLARKSKGVRLVASCVCADVEVTVISVVIGILAGIYLSSAVSLLILPLFTRKKKKTLKPDTLVTF